ncbi:MAG: transposase [Chloroflexota bacterium]|nr:transposase [Chloroflexota bacterium]MDE2918778.1 transposase [Chloroflexota bacterium]
MPIPYAPSRQEAARLQRTFQRWCRDRDLAEVGELLEHDWERMITFSHFPQAPWKHRHPTNVIVSPFAAVRLRTTAAKRDKRVANAPAVS